MVGYMEFAKENLAGKVIIGLSTGDILFSSLGTDCRREAGLLGDVVNIAARLITFEEFQSGIFVDEATHLGSSKLFMHTNKGEHKLKGKKEAIQLWTIAKDHQTLDLRDGFVEEVCGYEMERNDITDEYKEWYSHGSKAYVLIEGVSGAGKSKLGSFTMNLADKDKIPVCLVQGTEIEQRTPSTSSSVELFTRLRPSVCTEKFCKCKQPKRFYIALYHNEDPNLAPLLQYLLPAYTIPETNVTRALDAQAKSNLQKSVVFRIFNNFVSKHKCIFVFDDCQWFDEQSLEGILTIVKLSVNAFILILSRPIEHVSSETLQSLSKHYHIKRLVLPGLSKLAVQEIITRKFALKPTAAIVSKGSSFPLYTNMIGSLMQDMIGNQLYIDDNGCLRLSNSVNSMDDILLTSVGAGITLQYDSYKYVDRCAFPEGAQILTKVEDFFKTLGAKDGVTIDLWRRARWLAETAWANSNMKLTQNALSCALQSLDLITNGTWPHDERALKKKFIASLARLTKLWIITGGGKLTCRFLNKKSQLQKGTVNPSEYNHLDSDAIPARCFSSIAFAAFYDQKFPPALVGLSAIELLCNAIVQAPQNIFQWRAALSRCSFMFQFTLEPLARICFDKLVSMEDIEPKTFAHYLQLGILSVTVRARADKATECFYNYLRWCEQRGDVFGYRASHVMLGFLAIRTCNPLGPIEDVLIRLSLDSTTNDRVWTPTALAVRCVQNLMMMNFEMVATLILPLREIVPLLTATVPAGVSMALYLDAHATLLLRGNGRESLQLFHQAIANARGLDRIFSNAIEIMWLSSLFIWIYIDFERLGFLKAATTTETDYVYQWDLMNAVEDSQKLMYFLGVKKGIIPCWWALHLFEVASDVIKGDTALVARRLSKRLTSKRRNEIVQIELLLAMYYGVIARYSENKEEIIIFKRKARQLFERGNASLFLRWLG
ncbi:hypothetical protein HDU76_005063 [Blyttiomyces sp. JEL0837]|nr:hypothetical protein HDU76_005063 [Blyttiomyces sp. JEL0837]